MSLPVYVTVPLLRTRILSGSSRPANASEADSLMTQQPAWRPSVSRTIASRSFRSEKARTQKCFLRMSDSRGSRS